MRRIRWWLTCGTGKAAKFPHSILSAASEVSVAFRVEAPGGSLAGFRSCLNANDHLLAHEATGLN
jgi:hypothetical protein